jgi:hypothetical protein
MPILPIIKGILTIASLASSISKMSKNTKQPPSQTEGKKAWTAITIVNQTQFPLVFVGSYFDSGRFETSPTNALVFNEMTFTGVEKDGSWMTGVTGGVAFYLNLQGNNAEVAKYGIGIGFTSPYAGTYKASILNIEALDNSGAKVAYDKAIEDAVTFESETIKGIDKDGKETNFNFRCTSAPGKYAKITITEQIL